jgi:Tfp pilus assembly protein PilN
VEAVVSAKRVASHAGLALSASELIVAADRLPGAGAAGRRIPLEAPSSDGSSWPALAVALGELARVAGSERRLAVALLPPLTEARRLELPPLSDQEVQRLLTRNASRYFVNARGPQIVGAAGRARRARGTPATVLAAAAPARLVEAIHAAARGAGLEIKTIAPAEAAWAAAAIEIWPAAARDVATVLVAHDDRTDLLQLEEGRLVGVRRFRAGAGDADVLVGAITEGSGVTAASAKVFAFGRTVMRNELVRALSVRAVTVATPVATWAAQAEVPEMLAATFAGAVGGPLLRSEDTQSEHRAKVRRAATLVTVAAVVLLLAAAGVELWGVRRQLRAVQAKRAELRPQLASTLVGQMSVEGAYRRLTILAAAERQAPRWSAVLAALSARLPDDAYLTAFRGRGDSVVVDGLAERAAPVFDAIESTPGLREVRAAAPVRRETPASGESRERFTIAARTAMASESTAAARRVTP